MKRSIFYFRSMALIAVALFLHAVTEAQFYVKALNTNCYYHTSYDAKFTWSGGSNAGYCNGFGTIQWFDNYGNKTGKYTGYVSNGKNEGYGTFYYSDGSIYHQGYWKNDQMNGYGTIYNLDGSIKYKGNFKDDKFRNIDFLENKASEITVAVVKYIFDGGINLRYNIIKATYDYKDELEELQIGISFNGDIITTNYYEFTLVIKNEAPFVDFIDYNDRAYRYLVLKTIVGVIDIIDKILKD